MAAAGRLTTVLAAIQKSNNLKDIASILSSTSVLLTSLTNPSNITLLTSRLLSTSATWTIPLEIEHCWQIVGVYKSAATTIIQQQTECASQPHRLGRDALQINRWVRAVLHGADERSPACRHALVIAGVLLGMEVRNSAALPRSLRTTVETAMVTAINATLSQGRSCEHGVDAAILALQHCFSLLSHDVAAKLRFDRLVPAMINVMIGPCAFDHVQSLDAIEADITFDSERRVHWSKSSQSFLCLERLLTRPIMRSMGLLVKLLAHSIGCASSKQTILDVSNDLLLFSEEILDRFRHTRFASLDVAEESQSLSPETMQSTLPALWQLLKTALFAMINLLQAIISRSLVDRAMVRQDLPVVVAERTLLVARNLYFIILRLGPHAFSTYSFTFLAAIDILSCFPSQSKAFLYHLRHDQSGLTINHALDRNLSLFFLNVCEHLSFVLTTAESEKLVIQASLPYLGPLALTDSTDLIEAAHSAFLAVISAPQNAELGHSVMPRYFEALLAAFPKYISPRQFRLAVKTLARINVPATAGEQGDSLLSDSIVEILFQRATSSTTSTIVKVPQQSSDMNSNAQPWSEQSVIILSILDCMPVLWVGSLPMWLPLTVTLVNSVQDCRLKSIVQSRLWEILGTGELGIEHAAIAIDWWTTRGGRAKFLGADSSGRELRDRSSP